MRNLIHPLFYNGSSPAKTIDNLRLEPFEHHLFAMLVHLPNGVNVRQQAVNGMLFQVVDLALQFLDLHQYLLVFFLADQFTIQLVCNLVLAELGCQRELLVGEFVFDESRLTDIEEIQGLLRLV